MALREPGLIGRAGEVERLTQVLDRVRKGRSAVLVIRGEAGIGKTALLSYARARASGGQRAEIAGVESEMELPFAGLHQLCRPMLDRLDALPAQQRDALAVAFGLASGDVPDRFLVGLAALTLLASVAEEGPLVCLIDDAQWLDDASSQALGFVARRLVAEPMAIVFATRDPGVADVLVGLPELSLAGLDGDDARALLARVIPGRLDESVRDRIVAEARGNPLALRELPRGLPAARLAGGFGLPDALTLSDRIEKSFLRQLDGLPRDTELLMLTAGADPAGDPALLRRAAKRLGIAPATLEPGAWGDLLEVDERVRFRHPLVRSAVYRAASDEVRRRVHGALAEEIDAALEPDRRAWHRAQATVGPDEAVAAELERSAVRAQARGGVAAAAAFLQRAVALTPEPTRRVDRALAAAQASQRAGAFDAARQLIATAEVGPLEQFERVRADLLRAQIAFASTRGGSAPALLLRAAQLVEPFDATLAQSSYLEALSAAMFAARLAGPGGGVRDVARAVLARTAASSPTATDLLLDGWAAMFADGTAAAMPTLQAALKKFSDGSVSTDELHVLWLATITAGPAWDDKRWEALSKRHVELARSSGALSELPLALNSRSFIHLFRGELGAASGLIEEARAAIEATGASLTPWGAVALSVLRGREQDSTRLLEAATVDATERGEGISLTVLAWARALLCNGLGAYDRALAAAQTAIDCPTNSASAAWGMVELIEAATRVGELDAAREAGLRFAAIANAAGTDWALGVNARSLALREPAAAEQHYRRALDHLGRSQMRVDLARSHLLYGEWLRREKRRVDAREQLRVAYDQFTMIGMEAFAERARGELLATGEIVRARSPETRDDLTAQERQIAGLARDGLSNPEIGSRLFLSPRTVEWHLSNVFGKLGIRSRRELRNVLPRSGSELLPA